jgi:hypothetical protein
VQEQASAVLEWMRTGQPVPQDAREEAAALFVSLAEMYDGEYGYSYSSTALDVLPGQDRAVQLATYYGNILGRQVELPPRWKAYLAANPEGAMSGEVRRDLLAVDPQALAEPAAVPVVSAPAAAPSVAPVAEPVQEQPKAVEEAPIAEAVAAPAPVAAPEPVAVEPPSPEKMAKLLEVAAVFAQKRQSKEALAKYQEVLQIDPVSLEALAWVDEHFRSKRLYGDLRDVYQNASRAASIAPEQRKKFLTNVANICEQQLRDLDGAIQAFKQLSQIDSAARDNLRRLLEKGQRWDDLAVLLEQESSEAPDQEAQIALLKKLATLQEQKRKDVVAAGEAWARMASLTAGDDSPVQTAVKLFEKGNRLDLAAQVISDNCGAIDAPDARSALLVKLGELREKAGEQQGAGDAFAEAAELGAGLKAWEAAERCFVASERWQDAARAIGECANLTSDPKARSILHGREADLLFRSGDVTTGILRLEEAADLDPLNEEMASLLESRYQENERVSDLVEFVLKRASKLSEKERRIALRKRAADIQRNQLSEADAARDTLMMVLEDSDDVEALTLLADDARERGDHQEQVSLLHRLAIATSEPSAKAEVMLREAGVLARDLDDVEGAIARYESLLSSIDSKNTIALGEIADLEERRDNPKGAVSALERYLSLVTTPEEKTSLARRLADLYQGPLGDPRGAIRALEVVHASDPDDFDAISRLVELCESVEQWERTAELLKTLVDVEGDTEEQSKLSIRRALILCDRLERGQDALAALEGLADEGNEACRSTYVELGDKLNFKGIVAMKLRDWYSMSSGAKQHEAFRGAFERFVEMGRESDAAQMAVELIRSKGQTPEIVQRLEELATRLKDLDALSAAHDTMARELSGPDRAVEYVRQAEVLVQAGVDPSEAVQHGEQGLTSVAPAEVEPLLERLSGLLGTPGQVVDLYERQVGRCKHPNDRLLALARGAQVAAIRGAQDRAKSLFELALSGGARDETIEVLEKAAADGDAAQGGTSMRQLLADSLASGTTGLRDGGRTKASLLRRAAIIAQRELGDTDKAFRWLGEALVTHVETATLDALEDLGGEIGDYKRVEEIIGKALEEVFDGPLVRQLVGRRAKLRRERLEDMQGAAQDLKKLHDLSPADGSIIDELYGLLTELRDYRAMVQLLEDQILRGKDPAIRAELARKAARLWEERLQDSREAADAWRRVLRMKSGDSEAQAGLDRAKSNMLKRPASQLPPAPEELMAELKIGMPPAIKTPVHAAVPAHRPSEPKAAAPKAAPVVHEMSQQMPVDADKTPIPEGTEDLSMTSDGEIEPDSVPSPPPAFESDAGEMIPAKPTRPDISFVRSVEEEPTLATPVQQAPAQLQDIPLITDQYPAVPEYPVQNAAPIPAEVVPEDLIESIDEVESVDDAELLDAEPVAQEPVQPHFPRK